MSLTFLLLILSLDEHQFARLLTLKVLAKLISKLSGRRDRRPVRREIFDGHMNREANCSVVLFFSGEKKPELVSLNWKELIYT